LEQAGFIKTFVKKTLVLSLLFLLIYPVIIIFSYLESKTDCFPVTVITVEKKPVEELIKSIPTCSYSVESEKMTFDSSIFNHYETPPVKDIYLFYAEIPFSDWQLFSEMENSIPEANPFLLDVISRYASSKIRIFLLSYISLFFLGLLIMLRVAPSKKEPHYNFFKTSFFTSLMFVVFSLPAFFLFDSGILIFTTFIVSTLFIGYISILIILYRLTFTGETK
jgi:hypothetical protein